MEQLTALIEAATAAIPAEYFQLQIDGGDPVYRERVYCYELYHQLRRIWPGDTDFYLNGEIDKAAHPILKDLGASETKPDFLVHRPGYMSGNHAVIEVKTCRTDKAGIRKDIQVLSLFLGRVGYERAILLVFGGEVSNALLERIVAAAGDVKERMPIEVWFHHAVGTPAEVVVILD